MQRSTSIGGRVRVGIAAGLVAAAATAGALLGFGHARGAPLLPLNADAYLFLGARALRFERFDARVTTLGALIHVASLLVWGVLFALLAARLRGARLLLAALAFAAGAWVVDLFAVPDRLRPGFVALLGRGELVAVYLVLGLALAAGVASELGRSRER